MDSLRDRGDGDRLTRVGTCEAEAPAPPRLCWPGMSFGRRRVVALGRPAYRWTPDGELWEFEDGAFYVTGRGDRGERRCVADEQLAPEEGWSHSADCECPACCVNAF